MHKQLDSLLQREMTRKEFVATLGLGFASVLGLGSLLRFVNPEVSAHTTQSSNQSSSLGYGSNTYGN